LHGGPIGPPWGHGLGVNVFSDEGNLLNVVLFAAHPEFPDDDILQAKNTEELVDLAASQLKSDELEERLVSVRQSGLQLVIRLKLDASAAVEMHQPRQG
jgi:hypothetical protein